MKRLLLVLLALVSGLALLAWLPRQFRRDGGRWQPLPSGGEIRVRAVTYGTQHEVDLDDRSFWQRWKERFLPRARAGGPGGPPSQKLSETTDHALMVWLETRNHPPGIPAVINPDLRLPDGEVLNARQSGGSMLGQNRAIQHFSFQPVPYRVPRFTLAVQSEGRDFTFAVANPAARARLPVWTPRPLPQTQRMGEVALTLRSLRIEPSDGGRHFPPWLAQAEWSIARGDADAEDWYAVGYRYSDPGGNVSGFPISPSEPVWRIDGAIERTERYPFRADEVEWLGRIDPSAPGEPLAISDAARRLGVLSAACYTAGQYEIAPDGGIRAMANTPRDPNWHGAVEHNYETKKTIVRLEQTAVILLTGETSPLVLLQEEGDDRVQPGESSEHGVTTSRGIRLIPITAGPRRLGVAAHDPLPFDFYVAAPERPKVAPSPAPR